MLRKKITILKRIKHLFLDHLWLKAVSLALAVISWLYINYEMIVR